MWKFWCPGPKQHKMAVKTVGVFCNGYNELAFLCNGTDWHEIWAKTSIAVLYWTLIEEFWKFALNGVILQQTAIFLLLWRFYMSQAYRSVVTFFYSVPQCLHCKRCTSYVNSVRLSVCLSHAGIVSKRLHVARCSVHCQNSKMCLVL